MTPGPRLHGVLTVLAGLAALALTTLPAVLAFGLGWMSLGWSEGSGGLGHVVDDNPIEAWVVLALAFLLWVPVVVVAFVAALDRLGRHSTPVEREARPKKADERRRRAGLRYLAGRPAAPPAGRPASRPAAAERPAPAKRPAASAGLAAARVERPAAPAERPAAPAERPAARTTSPAPGGRGDV